MLEGFFNLFKGLDQRVKVAIAGTGIISWSQQLTSRYDQLYATSLGAKPVDLGLLNSVSAAIRAIISMPMGWAAEKYSIKKVMLLILTLFAANTAIFAFARNWWVLTFAYILSARVIRMMPLADIIFVTVTEPHRRSVIMGLSRLVWGIINIFAPMVAAIIVSSSGGINAQGIRPLYYIQLVSIISVFLLIFWKLQSTLSSGEKRDKSGSSLISLIRDYRGLFKGEKYLMRWVMLRLTMQFGTSLAMPFISLWIVDVKGANPYIIGVMSTVSVITALVFAIPVGWLADRIGRKKVFFIFESILWLGTLMLVLAPSPEYLILVGFLGFVAGTGGGLGNGIGGVGFTPFITMWWEAVPEEKRGRLFGIEGLFSLAAIPASIIGGILWQEGFMAVVLLIPILLEALIVIPMLATVPDKQTQSS